MQILFYLQTIWWGICHEKALFAYFAFTIFHWSLLCSNTQNRTSLLSGTILFLNFSLLSVFLNSSSSWLFLPVASCTELQSDWPLRDPHLWNRNVDQDSYVSTKDLWKREVAELWYKTYPDPPSWATYMADGIYCLNSQTQRVVKSSATSTSSNLNKAASYPSLSNPAEGCFSADSFECPHREWQITVLHPTVIGGKTTDQRCPP